MNKYLGESIWMVTRASGKWLLISSKSQLFERIQFLSSYYLDTQLIVSMDSSVWPLSKYVAPLTERSHQLIGNIRSIFEASYRLKAMFWGLCTDVYIKLTRGVRQKLIQFCGLLNATFGPANHPKPPRRSRLTQSNTQRMLWLPDTMILCNVVY